jgi:glyoxylase-like metal-dependent hydrolase (beta-lactamase superfamily II)
MAWRKAVPAAAAITVLLLGCQAEPGDQPTSSPNNSELESPAFEFTEVAPGVYVARGSGTVPTICNAAVIVNESDVVIVDSYTTPAAATALIKEIRSITPNPVRVLINTHFHIDHSFGNQAFPPEVEIISHEYTREVIASGGSVSGRGYELVVGMMTEQQARILSALDTVTDAGARSRLEDRVDWYDQFFSGVASVVPTPPTRTFSDRMTLFRGDREIRILFLGRGHTAGDVIVHLPEEKVLISGDFFQSGLPYMGDGFFPEWVDSLERLKSLEFDWIIGGHGAPFQDRERINHLQTYLRDFWAQATSLFEAGVPVNEAARRIDMRAHAEVYASARNLGVDSLQALRAYELLESGR